MQPISQYTIDLQVPSYNRSFDSLIQSYECKQIPVGLLHAEKMAEVVLLDVFRIGLPASLLGEKVNTFRYYRVAKG